MAETAKMPVSAVHPPTCPLCGPQAHRRPVSSRFAACDVCGWVVPFADPGQPPASNDPFPVGALVRDRYRIESVLGRGAHGVTMLARHEFLNHPCVVKALHAPVADEAESVRLRAEASAGFRVANPAVVRTLDCDCDDGRWYFVTEHIAGQSLAAMLAADVRVGWRQVGRLGIEIATGLRAIHEAGLIHRDIKPGNVLLGVDGRARVADLGVAALTAEATTPTGTVGYTAPEIARGAAPTAATDLYALGVVLAELLSGVSISAAGPYQAMLAAPLAKWRERVAADTPTWLTTCVERLLADADNRYTRAVDLITDLSRLGEQPMRTPAITPDRVEARGLVLMPFDNLGEKGDDWLGHALADHVGRTLATTRAAHMVDRSQFSATMERLSGIRPSYPERLRVAGRLVGAAHVVTGQFTRHEDSIQVEAAIETAQSGGRRALRGVRGSLSDLARLEAMICDQVAEALRLDEAEVSLMAQPRHVSVAATQRFFEAKRAFLRGDYESALTLGEKSVSEDPQFGEAIGFLGVCCTRMGRYDEAIRHNERQRKLAESANDTRLKVESLANLGSMHYFRGEHGAASEALLEAARIAESEGLASELALIRNNLGFALLQVGKRDEAKQAFLAAIETHKAHGAVVALIGPYNGVGHVLRDQGRYDEARTYFRKALALAQEGEDVVNTGVAFMNLGHCALMKDRLADAKHELAVALNLLEGTTFWNGLARVYEYMAELNLKLENDREAARCAQRRVELAERHANRAMLAEAWRQKAEALRRLGDSEAAQQADARAEAASRGETEEA